MDLEGDVDSGDTRGDPTGDGAEEAITTDGPLDVGR